LWSSKAESRTCKLSIFLVQENNGCPQLLLINSSQRPSFVQLSSKWKIYFLIFLFHWVGISRQRRITAWSDLNLGKWKILIREKRLINIKSFISHGTIKSALNIVVSLSLFHLTMWMDSIQNPSQEGHSLLQFVFQRKIGSDI
jgi:hypothetical protein